MYRTVFIDERVELSAKEFGGLTSADGLKDALVAKLKRNEGKCNANGYVKPGTVQLIARSMGTAENGKFTGNWIFDCKFSCDVLRPVAFDAKDPSSVKDAVLTVKIIDVNDMGAYGSFEEAIRVLLPRDLHAGNPAFNALKKGGTARVRMDKHRFQTNDDYIMAVGTLYEGGPELAATAAAAAADLEEEAAEEAAEATVEPKATTA
jgi:hypothetical protein